MRELSTVTLFAVACTHVDETIKAMQQSMREIKYHEALLITHEKRSLEHLGIKVITIEKLDYIGYNHFVLFRAKDYITTDYSLLVQHDGYVLRPEKWDDRFFNYDYIGAPWPKDAHFTSDGTNVRVGNGGFSFRSKKLLNALVDLNLPFTDKGSGFLHEDGILCVHHRAELEKNGITFASVEIAAKFSREITCSDSERLTFGFHKNLPKLFFLRPLLQKIHIEV